MTDDHEYLLKVAQCAAEDEFFLETKYETEMIERVVHYHLSVSTPSGGSADIRTASVRTSSASMTSRSKSIQTVKSSAE